MTTHNTLSAFTLLVATTLCLLAAANARWVYIPSLTHSYGNSKTLSSHAATQLLAPAPVSLTTSKVVSTHNKAPVVGAIKSSLAPTGATKSYTASSGYRPQSEDSYHSENYGPGNHESFKYNRHHPSDSGHHTGSVYNGNHHERHHEAYENQVESFGQHEDDYAAHHDSYGPVYQQSIYHNEGAQRSLLDQAILNKLLYSQTSSRTDFLEQALQQKRRIADMKLEALVSRLKNRLARRILEKTKSEEERILLEALQDRLNQPNNLDLVSTAMNDVNYQYEYQQTLGQPHHHVDNQNLVHQTYGSTNKHRYADTENQYRRYKSGYEHEEEKHDDQHGVKYPPHKEEHHEKYPPKHDDKHGVKYPPHKEEPHDKYPPKHDDHYAVKYPPHKEEHHEKYPPKHDDQHGVKYPPHKEEPHEKYPPKHDDQHGVKYPPHKEEHLEKYPADYYPQKYEKYDGDISQHGKSKNKVPEQHVQSEHKPYIEAPHEGPKKPVENHKVPEQHVEVRRDDNNGKRNDNERKRDVNDGKVSENERKRDDKDRKRDDNDRKRDDNDRKRDDNDRKRDENVRKRDDNDRRLNDIDRKRIDNDAKRNDNDGKNPTAQRPHPLFIKTRGSR